MSQRLLLLAIAFAAAVLPTPRLAAQPAGIAPAVEPDQRLQSQGKDWRLDQAKIDRTAGSPKLPRVLLIGDSILNGYQAAVLKAFEGKAHIDAWVNPHWQSQRTNELLADVLAHGPYDVVHFNIGLHGWPRGRIKDGTFEPLTKAYVEVLKTKLPQAKLIWASSTPVTVKGKPIELDPVINATIVDHNRMAANVMREMNVPVNDLYAVLVNRRDLALGDGFHWKPGGYDLLAREVIAAIEGALPAAK